MRSMDLSNIAQELRPDCNITRTIVFMLYKNYGMKSIEAYIETFAQPKVKKLANLKEWLISTYNKIKK